MSESRQSALKLAPAPAAERWILYERLVGAAARARAEACPPEGAGLTVEEALRVEYVEVWGHPGDETGFDLRMYSFGGTVVAVRSTSR
jgi:hypothetical protein